ncbi:MAG: low molecular weight phosphatase family protein [Jatrophihabitans sp.]|nr:low molecular weight phosphatase family protein [Jatrophihabitans sp.]
MRGALPELRIASAGTAALVGEPVNPRVARLLETRGLREPVDLPQQLTGALLRSSRLVITAERGHRLEALEHDRTAANRTVTLKELARLLTGAPTGIGIDAALRLVAERWAAADDVDHDDDLADPYRRSWAHYRRLGDEVDAALAVIVPVLRSQP